MEMVKFFDADKESVDISAISQAWRARIDEVLSLACTADTVQDVKKARSELSGEFAVAEDSRKAYKQKIMDEYDEKAAIYKEEISDPYNLADATLKERIDKVENEQKADCEKRLRIYFAELCQREHLGWLTYENAGITIDLTSAKQKKPKRLIFRLEEFVARVANERDAISRMPDADEIMLEYRRCLNMAQAVETVRQRHEEMERVRNRTAQETAARDAESAAVTMVESAAPVVVERMEPQQDTAEPPTQDDRVVPCRFTVTTTIAKLKKLKEFLIREGIPYVN